MKTKIKIALVAFILFNNNAEANILLNVDLETRFLNWLISILAIIAFVSWIISNKLEVKRNYKNEEEKSEEADGMLGHNYDGIKELDNDLPLWWLYGFYLTIFFAATYMVDYHVLKSSPLSEEEYLEEMAYAEASILKNEKSLQKKLEVRVDDEAMASGKKIYEMNCLACHGSDGGGTVGPNLTDNYWINGGSFDDIFEIIKNGVPEKGMIAWNTMLNPTQIQEVTSYIMTLEEVEGKSPQGELYTE